jgi:hypothetical protein
MSNKKEYAPELSLYPTKDGKYNRVSITEQNLETLKKATLGSALLLMEVSDETKAKIVAGAKAKGRKDATAPSYKLVILPANDNPAYSRSDDI